MKYIILILFVFMSVAKAADKDDYWTFTSIQVICNGTAASLEQNLSMKIEILLKPWAFLLLNLLIIFSIGLERVDH